MELKYVKSFQGNSAKDNYSYGISFECMSFSPCGKYLAAGHKNGHLFITQVRSKPSKSSKNSVIFLAEFGAHRSRFDRDHSQMTDTKVNGVSWIPQSALNPVLLTCNNNDAFMWRMYDNQTIQWSSMPKITSLDEFIPPAPDSMRRNYIVSKDQRFSSPLTTCLIDIKCLADQCSFLLIDQQLVLQFDIQRKVEPVVLYSINGPRAPLISSAAVHHKYSSIFIIGNEHGTCSLLDSRQQSDFLTPSMTFETAKATSPDKRFGLTRAVTSIDFSKLSNQVVFRNFGGLQTYDLRNPATPLDILELQWFPQRMNWLSESGFLHDRFGVTFARDDKIISGLYGNDVVVWDQKNQTTSRHRITNPTLREETLKPGADFSKRVACVAAHPDHDIIALASDDTLYFYLDISAKGS